MRYPLKKKYVALAAVGFVLGWILSDNVIVGLALFAFLLTPAWWDNYLRYAKDNPQRLWFKRKLYGWGWTPVTWQGWLAVLAYAGLVISSVSFAPEEMTAVFLVIISTAAFVGLCYYKGEKPRWQWGNDGE